MTLKELRKFGLIQAVALETLAGLLFWKQSPVSIFFALAGFVVFLLAVFSPQLLKFDYKLINAVGKIISLILTKAVLIILFYLVISPIALLARITGKKFLDLGIDKQKTTYWLTAKKIHRQKEDYLKQF